MPAPIGNKHAAKDGISKAVRLRLTDKAEYDLIMAALPSPEERGAALLKAAKEAAKETGQ
jgi:uncharacterized protein (DUF1778 family)